MMYMRIEQEFICGQCGYRGEPDYLSHRVSATESKAYYVCPSCGHKAEMYTTTSTDNTGVVYKSEPRKPIEY